MSDFRVTVVQRHPQAVYSYTVDLDSREAAIDFADTARQEYADEGADASVQAEERIGGVWVLIAENGD